MLKRLWPCAFILVGCLVLPKAQAQSSTKRPQGEARSSAIARPQQYVLIWDFDASKATRTPSGEILIPAPSSEPYQKVRWELSGVRTQRVVEVEGGRVIAVQPIGPYFRLRLVVEPTGTEIPRPSRSLRVPADALACLRDNTAFAAKNARTAKLARELKSADSTETVKNVLRWIKANIKYRYDEALIAKQSEPVGGVDSILQDKLADCGGHSLLFMYLCRQAGVPARVLWGPVREESMKYRPQRNSLGQIEPGPVTPGPLKVATNLPTNYGDLGDFSGHAWAEVYLKEWGWVPLEPQDAETPLGRIPKDYVPFLRFLDNRWDPEGPAGLALSNVGEMNYYPHLELPEERDAPRPNATPSQSSARAK